MPAGVFLIARFVQKMIAGAETQQLAGRHLRQINQPFRDGAAETADQAVLFHAWRRCGSARRLDCRYSSSSGLIGVEADHLDRESLPAQHGSGLQGQRQHGPGREQADVLARLHHQSLAENEFRLALVDDRLALFAQCEYRPADPERARPAWPDGPRPDRRGRRRSCPARPAERRCPRRHDASPPERRTTSPAPTPTTTTGR